MPPPPLTAIAPEWLTPLPLSIVIGGPVSGALLEMDGFLGLAGWRWLFLLEGAPAIILGICVLIWLPNLPADAKWLTDDEKRAVLALLPARRPIPDRPAA